MIPPGSEKIIAARMKGKKPAAMVLVTLGEAPTGVDNPVVKASPAIAYDWRFVRGLEVCVYVTDDDDWPMLVKDIAMQRPDYLGLWNRVGKWGAHVYLPPTADSVDKPVRNWRYELDFLPWMDFENQDFVERRRYERDENGMPYAI